jgi:hypothetical protein
MTRTNRLKTAVAGFVAAGAFALGATAQAVTLDAGVFNSTLGSEANPVVINVPQTGGFFLDTINFDLGSFTHFNMTSTNNLTNFFGVPIFENNNDTEVVAAAATFTNQPLADLGLSRDYHLHPSGIGASSGSYTLTMWGSTLGGPGVPIPGAVWLFGTGVAGLVGLARRKMMARA